MNRLDRVAATVAVVVVAAVTACGTDTVPTTTHGGATPATVAATPPSSAVAFAVPEPDRPFTAEDILAAMRASNRPGGVPDLVETDAVAAAIADALWTWDGTPWTSIAASGSCGDAGCTVELGGSPAGAAGEDVWVFGVDTATGEVSTVSADLHGLAPEAAGALDDAARAALTARDDVPSDELLLTAVRWLPPPDTGTFELAYRSGDEEGSCSVDVVLDARTGEIDDVRANGC